MERVRILRNVQLGVIGTGNRGSYLFQTLLSFPGVAVPAVCDINPEAAARAVFEKHFARPSAAALPIERIVVSLASNEGDAGPAPAGFAATAAGLMPLAINALRDRHHDALVQLRVADPDEVSGLVRRGDVATGARRG